MYNLFLLLIFVQVVTNEPDIDCYDYKNKILRYGFLKGHLESYLIISEMGQKRDRNGRKKQSNCWERVFVWSQNWNWQCREKNGSRWWVCCFLSISFPTFNFIFNTWSPLIAGRGLKGRISIFWHFEIFVLLYLLHTKAHHLAKVHPTNRSNRGIAVK